jgi:hypothetical protein
VPSTDLGWEEDNVFGFFTAGVSTHESTDRDKHSESTLVASTALLDGWGSDCRLKNLADGSRWRIALTNRTHEAPPSADEVFYEAFQSSYFERAGLSRVLEPWNYTGNTA